MKKLYSFTLLLMMALVCGFTASAASINVEWDEPGAVQIKLGGLGNPYVELAADATSYTYENTAAGYVYFFAADGYFLNSVTFPDGTTANPTSNATYGRFASKFINANHLTTWEGKTIKVNVTKINRTSEFNFDVVNGASYFTATFSGSGYALDLKNGENKVMFDPTIDTNLQISYINGSIAGNPSPALYSVTYDGTAVEKARYYERWDIPTVEAGSNVTVRVFEGEEPVIVNCDLTLDIPAGMEDCIVSIRDWTKSVFITPEDNKFTVTKDTDLSLNFNTEDFDVTDVLYNGTSLQDKFQNSGARCRFTVTESGTLQIVGAPKTVDATVFTAYIQNPEGVVIEKGYMSEEYADLTNGTAVTEATKISGYTMPADETKSFTFEMTDKNPLLFISPKEGYYIVTVQYKEGESFETQTSAINKENTTFYVIAKKLGDTYTADFNVTGDSRLILSGSSLSNWDNPKHTYSLKDGSQQISFYPGYDLPLTLRAIGLAENFEVYVDGKVASKDSDNEDAYVINPYYPASASDAQLHSTVTVFADGTSKGKTGTVSLKTTGTTAKMLYSTVRANGGTSATLLYGTPVYIIPASKNDIIKVGNTVVNGTDADGNPVNGLNEDGEYVMTVDAAMTTVTVTAAPKTFDFLKVSPADGETVNEFSTLNVFTPMELGANYNMPYTTIEKVQKISVTPKDGEPVYATGLGEMGADYSTGGIKFEITFDAVTTAGEYTLNIPEGTFFESEYDAQFEETVEVEDGEVSKAYTSTFTIDPNAKNAIDIYTLKPASGSALNKLDVVYLTMTELSAYAMVQYPEEYVEGAFSNGAKSYNAMVGYDWDNVDARGFMIVPCDDEYNQVSITEEGTWELYLPAGTFKYNDQVSQAVEAVYNISAENPAYPITPAPGSTVTNLSKFTIEFINVAEVEYNDSYITLEGVYNFSTNTNFVSGTNPYTIQFGTLPTEAGEYTLTIPAGAFTVDGQASEAVTAKYTFKPCYEITPANGETVENLNEFTVTFPEAEKVEFVGGQQSAVVTVGRNYATPGYECEAVNDNTFKFTLMEGALAMPTGIASLLIEEGSFLVDGENSPEIRASYQIQRQVSLDWTATPEKTVIYSEYGFYVAFAFDETAVLSYPDRSKVHVNFCGEDLNASQYDVMSESQYLMLNFYDASLMKAGELKVNVEAGAFTVSGTPNPEMSYNWDIVAPKDYTSTVIPADDKAVADLSTITIAFPEAETAELFNINYISLMKSDYSYNVKPTVEAVAEAEYPTFKLTFNPAPETKGNYSLTCYEGAFTLDGAQGSPEIRLNYNFDKSTGIGYIGIDADSNVTIVTLDGRVIATDVPASVITTLEKGKVYIINGVKVYIK